MYRCKKCNGILIPKARLFKFFDELAEIYCETCLQDKVGTLLSRLTKKLDQD